MGSRDVTAHDGIEEVEGLVKVGDEETMGEGETLRAMAVFGVCKVMRGLSCEDVLEDGNKETRDEGDIFEE